MLLDHLALKVGHSRSLLQTELARSMKSGRLGVDVTFFGVVASLEVLGQLITTVNLQVADLALISLILLQDNLHFGLLHLIRDDHVQLGILVMILGIHMIQVLLEIKGFFVTKCALVNVIPQVLKTEMFFNFFLGRFLHSTDLAFQLIVGIHDVTDLRMLDGFFFLGRGEGATKVDATVILGNLLMIGQDMPKDFLEGPFETIAAVAIINQRLVQYFSHLEHEWQSVES